MTYDTPTDLLLARYEALADLRTDEAVELADEIACRLDESPKRFFRTDRYTYRPDRHLGFTRANRRFFGRPANNDYRSALRPADRRREVVAAC